MKHVAMPVLLVLWVVSGCGPSVQSPDVSQTAVDAAVLDILGGDSVADSAVSGDAIVALDAAVPDVSTIDEAQATDRFVGVPDSSTLLDVSVVPDVSASFGLFSLQNTAYDVVENAGQIEIVVERSGGFFGEVSVSYSTRRLGEGLSPFAQDADFVQPGDYDGHFAPLVFSAGVQQQSFFISIIDDLKPEVAETFEVYLLDPTGGAQLGSIEQTQATVTIVDDDTATPDAAYPDARGVPDAGGNPDTAVIPDAVISDLATVPDHSSAADTSRVGDTGVVVGRCPTGAIFCSDFDTELYGAQGARLYPRNMSGDCAQTLSSAIRHSGTKALRMTFDGSCNNELGFILGANYEDVYVRFYAYYPDGSEPNEIRYIHRDGPSSDNNKLARIFGDDYTNPNKMGASSRPVVDGVTRFFLESKLSGPWPPAWTCGGSMGGLRDVPSWTMPQGDLGRWIAIELHFKSDSGAGDGALEMWIDGQYVSGRNNVSIGDAPCSPNYFNQGFLFGPANAGYDEPTNVYVDDIVFATSYIGP